MITTKRPLHPSILRHNKRIRSTAQQSPEYHWRELDAIGRALLGLNNKDSDAGVDAVEALERIAVWKIRSSKVPHAIESTAALSQILLREKKDGLVLSTTELRLAYACAILRAINGLADTLQQQRSMAASVAVLCSELGVPAWLVAIRHEATHNQLPPLPTLRMAANALLRYFQTVYWEPMSHIRLDAYDLAAELLREYEAAAIEMEQSKKCKPSSGPDQEIPTDESSSSEEENDRTIVGFGQPVPGTTSNRFALLLDDKPKKKTAPPEQKMKEKRMKKPTANTPRDRNKTTSSVCAQKFVKTKIPFDVAQNAALDFLVLGSPGARYGVLVNDDWDSLSNRYRILLSVLCRTWPGFICSLLTSFVDLLLSIENSSSVEISDSPYASLCERLELWIRYVLSRKFLGQFDPLAKAENKGNERLADIAPLSVLSALHIPINRLCDRCAAVSNDGVLTQRHSTSVRLSELFAEILGVHRIVNYGIALAPEESSPELKHMAKAVKVVPEPNKFPSVSLSLETMEALLTGEATTVTTCASGKICVSSTDPIQLDIVKPSSIWVRCTSWEPCAIGALL